ncbi:MAG: lysozyme [Bacteroidetes bacterium]|nr:hypothetical protein AWN76_007795 [Rhodothermaceae bacterium RA]RMH67121.1 MAG: lysozyme [Bacteroidota bacterium]
MPHFFDPNDILDVNEAGLDLIKQAEAFRPTWYLCPARVWTIGYGTTEDSMPGVNRRQMPGPISRPQAESLLMRALVAYYEPAVETRVHVPLTRNQFSALVSFVYNVGAQKFASSTLLRKLNEGDYDGAAAEFDRWVFAGGERLRGLVTRRQAERALFLERPPEVVEERIRVVEGLERLEPRSTQTLPTVDLDVPPEDLRPS